MKLDSEAPVRQFGKHLKVAKIIRVWQTWVKVSKS